ALAIVLDNSMSSGAVVDDGAVLDRLVRQADAVLASASADDRLLLVTVDGAVRSGAASGLREALGELRPIDGAGSLPDAIARAATILSSAGLPARHMLVLTDGQASAWQESVAVPDGAVTLYLPSGELPPNHAVVEASATPPRWTPRGAVAARLIVEDSATWRVALDDRTLARGIAQSGEELLVRVAPAARGWLAGLVELQPDEL